MEYSFGITDVIDNLDKIKRALESDKFLKLMSSVKFTNNKYERRVIQTFKKDFWKEFIDE
jgi:hypothetical protein